eukprot:8983210-Alexandrium_andersonii.AAC.1
MSGTEAVGARTTQSAYLATKAAAVEAGSWSRSVMPCHAWRMRASTPWGPPQWSHQHRGRTRCH